MGRLWRDLLQLRSEYQRLSAAEATEEEDASLEIARSARDFSQRTKSVVDDKLAFSATLMRAGEVEAANRLLAEVEVDVLEEEAALFEKVNEVKATRALKRQRITRLRLARMVTVAMLGSLLMSASAIGITLASGADEDRPGAVAPRDLPNLANGGAVRAQADRDSSAAREVKIAGVKVRMSNAQLRAYSRLTNGTPESAEVHEFLLSLLPVEVQDMVVAAGTILTAEVPETNQPVIDIPKEIRKGKREWTSRQEEPPQEKPEPSPEPTDPSDEEPAEDPSPEPEPEPQPEPTPSPSDEEKDEGEQLPIIDDSLL